MLPTNEAETIEFFKAIQNELDWRIVHLQRAFPDAIIENSRGQRLTVEFEYKAKNFKEHGHNPAECDLIVCWINDWPDAPIAVYELQADIQTFFDEYVAFVNSQLQRKSGATEHALEIARFRLRNAERELKLTKSRLEATQRNARHVVGVFHLGQTRVCVESVKDYERFSKFCRALWCFRNSHDLGDAQSALRELGIPVTDPELGGCLVPEIWLQVGG